MRNCRPESIVALLLSSLCVCVAVALVPPAQATEEPITVRFAVYDNKPKIWRDENGVAQGLFADVLRAVAEKEGWEIEYVHGTWDEGLDRLVKNEVDIMPDVAWSEERAQLYDFNEETVMVNWGALYTRPGVEIESILDLEGKRIAVMESGILYSGAAGLKDIIDSFGITAEIIDVEVYGDVFKLLDEGKADVGVVNRIFGIAHEKDYSVRRTTVIFQPSELKYAFTKGVPNSAYLISRIDEGLKEMKDDTSSAYHESFIRHMGGIIREVEVFPRWFKYLASGILALIAVVLGYIFILRAVRRRLEALVEKRTAELKAGEEKYRLLIESIQDVIYSLDPQGKILFVSHRVGHYGWRPEDLVGRDFTDFVVTEDRQEITAHYRQMVAEGTETRVTARFTAKGGQAVWFEATSRLRHDEAGRPVGAFGVLRDVTERKKAEEEIRLREKETENALMRTKQLFENVPDAIFVADAETHKLIDCNENAVKLVGRPKEEIFSMAADELHPKDRIEDTMRGFQMQIEKKIKVVATEVLSKAGRRIPVEVNSVPFDFAGRKCLLGVFRDITEQKLAKEKVAALDRLKGRFITVLTHVTRTPLNRIRWSLESLDSGDFGKLKKEGRTLVRQAMESNEEVLLVMNNMNTTLDIERGALTLERMPTSFESLVESVVKQIKARPDCQDMVCRLDVPDKKLPAVSVDLEKMRSVIYGFMDNVRRFMTEGGSEVAMKIERRNGRVRFSITDKGIGIPEAEQKYIFGRFFRASNAMLKYPDGMGLGLYIAKSVVEKHGGSVGFESKEGKGSTFWFELPVAE
jgi:PAS domain S-box-containing protein